MGILPPRRPDSISSNNNMVSGQEKKVTKPMTRRQLMAARSAGAIDRFPQTDLDQFVTNPDGTTRLLGDNEKTTLDLRSPDARNQTQ